MSLLFFRIGQYGELDPFVWAPAAAQLYDAQGEPAGFGPVVNPYNVFWVSDGEGGYVLRDDLSPNNRWRVSSVSVAGVTITPLEGGVPSIQGPSGTSGTFAWALEGPEPTVGQRAFSIP